MDPKPMDTTAIEARGNAWLIIVIRHGLATSGWNGYKYWKPKEEIIRGPVGYPGGEEKYKALRYAGEQQIKRRIFGPVEVREDSLETRMKDEVRE